MNSLAPLAVRKLHHVPRFVAIIFFATVLAACGKVQPTCIDGPTVTLVKQLVEEALAKDMAAASDSGMLERLKQRMQIAVTTIRTSNKDEKIGKVTCQASLEITLADAGQIVADPAFKALRDSEQVPASVDAGGPAWKTDIQYTAQHTEDTKHLLVELSGHAPMVALLSTVAQSGIMEPKRAPGDIPANLLASGNARDAAARLMNHVYGKQEAANGCWMSRFEGLPYCMKIVQTEIKALGSGKRLYTLATGQAVDRQGEAITAHAMQGLVGAFIVGERNGKAVLMAQSTTIQAGTMGTAPSEWTLTELGANNNWGWRGEYGDCHQGYCGTRMVILAHRAGTVQELGQIPIAYDNSGACGDDECTDKASTLEAAVQFSKQPEDAEFFDLLVTVSGSSDGTALEPKVWTLPFDSVKQTYTEPADWPLADRDF